MYEGSPEQNGNLKDWSLTISQSWPEDLVKGNKAHIH